MARKLKGLAGAMSENQLAATIRASAQQIWLAGLGAFSTARAEGNKVFEALVKEGATIQSLAQKAAQARLRKTAAKVAGTRHKLEQVLEDSVARSLKRFGVPTRKDVDNLSKRITALTALVDKKRAAAARKTAAARRQ
jgi:poly(hydroxyalkanoate) granule-associated protein